MTKGEQKGSRVAVRLNYELREKLELYAEREGLSISDVIRAALEEYLSKRELSWNKIIMSISLPRVIAEELAKLEHNGIIPSIDAAIYTALDQWLEKKRTEYPWLREGSR